MYFNAFYCIAFLNFFLNLSGVIQTTKQLKTKKGKFDVRFWFKKSC